MTERYDVAVVGVGGMGSAALYHLARRGARVVGLERFDVPHERGSSHGVTRIIRQAYFEDSRYVPLVMRAYDLWRELEQEASEQLLHVTGSLEGGPKIFEGAVRASVEHGLVHEQIDGAEAAQRFPGFRLPSELPLVYQPDGGFVLPERAIVAHVEGAKRNGAEVRTGERVLEWSAGENGVRVRTQAGEIAADRVVLTAGAYAQDVARLPPGTVVAQRQVLAWFEPREPDLFELGRFPVFNLALEEGHLYGFPVFRVPGFKVGFYDEEGERGDPDELARDVRPEDEPRTRRFVERYFPAADGRLLDLKTCLFELSPDDHFVIDRHPETALAVVAAGFSGHGFKFCPVVGEILADLALDGSTLHEIELFGLDRFA